MSNKMPIDQAMTVLQICFPEMSFKGDGNTIISSEIKTSHYNELYDRLYASESFWEYWGQAKTTR